MVVRPSIISSTQKPFGTDVANPGFVEIETIRTRAPLADSSEVSIESALVEAAEAATRRTLAMACLA